MSHRDKFALQVLRAWVGRPDPAVRFVPADGYLVPFSILWGGFALFWEGTVLASGGVSFFALFGLPFVAVGAYITVGRFIYKARRKRETAYGLTSERAMVAVGASSFADSPVKQVPTSVPRNRDGQHVSVVFGNTGGWASGAMYANTGMEFFSRGPATVGFFDVADGAQLLTTLTRIQGS